MKWKEGIAMVGSWESKLILSLCWRIWKHDTHHPPNPLIIPLPLWY